MALIFLSILGVAIVIFLLGVSVGKKYRESQFEASEHKATALPKVKTLSSDILPEKKAESSLVAEKIAEPELQTQVQKTTSEPKKLLETPPANKEIKAEKPEFKPPIKVMQEIKIAQPSPQNYFVQIAAFSRKEACNSVVQELKKAGYQTVVLDPFPNDKTPLYRIRIGPFSSEKEAEAARNKVRTLIPAASKAFIVRY